MNEKKVQYKLSPKDRAKLKSLANGISQRYLLGKSDLDDAFLNLIDKALEAKELIKVGLLQSCEATPREVGERLEETLGAYIVQTIGRIVILYRPSKKDPKIHLD